MNEFKTWVRVEEDTWWVCRSTSPYDTRPFRILGKFTTENEAQTFLLELWSMK